MTTCCLLGRSTLVIWWGEYRLPVFSLFHKMIASNLQIKLWNWKQTFPVENCWFWIQLLMQCAVAQTNGLYCTSLICFCGYQNLQFVCAARHTEAASDGANGWKTSADDDPNCATTWCSSTGTYTLHTRKPEHHEDRDKNYKTSTEWRTVMADRFWMLSLIIYWKDFKLMELLILEIKFSNWKSQFVTWCLPNLNFSCDLNTIQWSN